MTYYGDDGGRTEVIPELPIRICTDDNNGDYVKLRQGPEDAELETAVGDAAEVLPPGRVRSLWYWVKWVVLFICIGLLVAVFFKWVGPFFMDKEIIPILIWERTTFSLPVLTVLLFASIASFPTLLLPSSPSMWVAGMTFGYGFGFLLIITAASVGVSLPFFIGSIFHQKIQGWLERYPKKASLLRSAGEGDWFHQFRAVALIRISPFPYIIYNYCAVATNVKYGPYLMGSLVGMVPEIFAAIYTGILIMTLADASQERHTLAAPQIIFNIIGFCFTVATGIFCTVYAKKWLKELGNEDEEVLLQ